MADRLDKDGLSLYSQKTEPMGWYYEDSGGIDVYIQPAPNTDAVHTRISWRKLVKSVERYQAGRKAKAGKGKAKGK